MRTREIWVNRRNSARRQRRRPSRETGDGPIPNSENKRGGRNGEKKKTALCGNSGTDAIGSFPCCFLIGRQLAWIGKPTNEPTRMENKRSLLKIIKQKSWRNRWILLSLNTWTQQKKTVDRIFISDCPPFFVHQRERNNERRVDF